MSFLKANPICEDTGTIFEQIETDSKFSNTAMADTHSKEGILNKVATTLLNRAGIIKVLQYVSLYCLFLCAIPRWLAVQSANADPGGGD
ncbi:MAG: hypothetical protein M1836_001469 [Candelina mexicana]|nr:MAG: hypothetical protein M1836_001469 [Candelina mexicana]